LLEYIQQHIAIHRLCLKTTGKTAGHKLNFTSNLQPEFAVIVQPQFTFQVEWQDVTHTENSKTFVIGKITSLKNRSDEGEMGLSTWSSRATQGG
jgi:hypothetical protein